MPNPLRKPVEGALPPEAVRILNLSAQPQTDGRRVRVRVSITPFEKDPSLECFVLDSAGEEVARVFIIETAMPDLLFTMHLRQAAQPTPYTLTARLYYEETGVLSEQSATFQFEGPTP
ncbi:MAG: hypothetical protein LDL12_03830 [Anaerolinea sp.]|nr:hypothetical protein [Anaerolinea sp.]